MGAPDYLEPHVGWRVWAFAELGGDIRLSSLVYREPWPVRNELSAICRLGERLPLSSVQRSLPEHAAPAIRCSCGIYAARALEHALIYLETDSEGSGAGPLRVLGRVSIWGTVVEAELGWRASLAYPARIYVPLGLGAGRAEEVGLALAAYGVPVELLECEADAAAIGATLTCGRS